jgi:pimeloyl-ACP methyl ester carboxylesterase
MKRAIAVSVVAILVCAPAAAPGAGFPPPWKKVRVNGVELEYSVTGKGDPVLLIHGSILANAFAPLLSEPALKGRLITYHRRGFAGSARATPPVTIADQAKDARRLLAALGVKRAHVVGHSYGGAIALQLALDAPDVVRSLALLEVAPIFAADLPSAPPFFEAVSAAPWALSSRATRRRRSTAS